MSCDIMTDTMETSFVFLHFNSRWFPCAWEKLCEIPIVDKVSRNHGKQENTNLKETTQTHKCHLKYVENQRAISLGNNTLVL